MKTETEKRIKAIVAGNCHIETWDVFPQQSVIFATVRKHGADKSSPVGLLIVETNKPMPKDSATGAALSIIYFEEAEQQLSEGRESVCMVIARPNALQFVELVPELVCRRDDGTECVVIASDDGAIYFNE